VGERSLSLAFVVPLEVDGPVSFAFHLPGDAVPIRGVGRVTETVVGEGEEERAERRVIELEELDEEARARIANYVVERQSFR
jgi:hypothetical protein